VKSRTLAWFTGMTLVAALGIAHRLPAQNAQAQEHTRYAIKVLDTLGGSFGEAWGINNRGLAAGISTTTGDATLDARVGRMRT
jgi:hypothetical protein